MPAEFRRMEEQSSTERKLSKQKIASWITEW
jgi:hypothetical protein